MIPFNLLPKPYDRQYFVAGGYAACPALADDVDVWVPLVPFRVPPSGINVLIVAYRDIQGWFLKQGFQGELYDYPDVDDPDHYISGSEGISVWKVAKVIDPLGLRKPIHIMITTGTIDDVLAGFDISTHQIAITATGQVVKGDHWTPLYAYPQVLWPANDRTPGRLSKICDRYKLKGQTYSFPNQMVLPSTIAHFECGELHGED